MLKTWYFTFGCGQPLAGHCQPIKAYDFWSARAKMVELHGIVWCGQYSEDDWNGFKNDKHRMWDMEKELPIIETEEVHA